MTSYPNPWRERGLPASAELAGDAVAADPRRVLALLRQCPAAAATPLHEVPSLAESLGIGTLWLKDERGRMGLGSFKALGAAAVIAGDAMERLGRPLSDDPAAFDGLRDDPAVRSALEGRVYVCASAGNHGLSVAAGARVFGARAVIYLADAVPVSFAERLRAYDAEVRRVAGDYEASMAAAGEAAEQNEGWILLSDSTWPGYTAMPYRVMEGYLAMAAEVGTALDAPPTHIFLQAGVGGMAAAVAAWSRRHWGSAPAIVVVEPEAAPALIESVRAGEPAATSGPASAMGRLDCKVPSHLALGALARDADWFVTIGEAEAAAAVERLREAGIDTTPSGAAGVAGLVSCLESPGSFGLDASSRVLAFVSEAPEA